MVEGCHRGGRAVGFGGGGGSGGGEVRLLNLDDVDTSSLGNGKFLVFNSTTQKLEFTDQVDGN